MRKKENDNGENDVKATEEKEKKTYSSRSRHSRSRTSPPSPEKPAFVKRKRLYKRRSFRRQYALFREGGLGAFDSFFNAFYIVLTERSIEKESHRLQSSGEEEVSSHRFLEHDTWFLRALSFLPRKLGGALGFLASFWKRNDGEKSHRSKLAFLKSHAIHFTILALSILIGIFIILQLSRPVVLRAEIDGKVIGVVENKHLVDSAVNELEDNVEIILGKSFHFPHEIRYSFARSWGKSLTEKSKISETLYTYVSEYICTAGGLYVDDVLVAVCEDAESVNRGLEDFINANSENGEAGIFNEIRVITQAYPTESILTYDEFQLLLQEMTVPTEERKKEPVPGDTVLSEVLTPETEEDEALPAMVLMADSAYVPEEKAVSYSNYPQPIGDIKLDLYTLKTESYQTAIPYETVYVESSDHYTSMADVTTRGSDGIADVEVKVYYVDGKEVKRETVSQRVKKEPVNRVISIGTKVLPESLGISASSDGFIVPRVGYVSYYYGERESGMHSGWDIPGDEGDNVYASASGKVVVAIGPNGFFAEKSANHYTGYGYCVVIEHENGFSTMYAHCSDIFVTLGQEVKQGEKIAEVGNTGWSDGDHVHFEILRNGAKVDPAQYLYQGKKTIYD